MHYHRGQLNHRALSTKERLKLYESHNPGDRQNPDPQRRLYGRCGCQVCAEIRKMWQDQPTALDRPGREGGANMASVNLCDRKGCKAMVKGVALGFITIVVSSEPDAVRKNYEVCPGCVADVAELLNEQPSTNRQAAYSDPYREQESGVSKSNVDEITDLLLEKLRNERKAIEG